MQSLPMKTGLRRWVLRVEVPEGVAHHYPAPPQRSLSRYPKIRREFHLRVRACSDVGPNLEGLESLGVREERIRRDTPTLPRLPWTQPRVQQGSQKPLADC